MGSIISIAIGWVKPNDGLKDSNEKLYPPPTEMVSLLNKLLKQKESFELKKIDEVDNSILIEFNENYLKLDNSVIISSQIVNVYILPSNPQKYNSFWLSTPKVEI